MSDSFHLGDLLSITHDRLLSPKHIGGVYEILNHMTGDDLMTHQLPLAADAMKPELMLQHPWLADVRVPEKVAIPDLIAWLDWATEEYGESHEVQPESHEVQPAPIAWGQHDPLQDFHNQWPDKPVIAISIDDGGDPS